MIRFLLIGLAALAVVPTAQATTLKSTPFGALDGFVYSDGSRWAAWQVDDATTRVLDARTGKTTDVTIPADCRTGRGVPYGAGLSAVGGGQLAWACSGAANSLAVYPMLLTLSTMKMHEPEGLAAFIASGSAGGCFGTIDGVGQDWVRYGCPGDGGHGWDMYYDWHTGVINNAPPKSGHHHRESLDTPSRTASVCSPVLVAQTDADDGLRAPIGGYGVREASGWVLGTEDDEVTAVQACGSKKITRVGCGNVCFASIGDGWLTYADTFGAYARQLQRRTLGPRLTLDAGGPPSRVVGAGRIVLGTTQQTPSALRVWRLPGAPKLSPTP